MLTKMKTAPKTSLAAKLWADRADLVSTGTAAYTDVVVDHAQNAKLWDVDGKQYIDFAGCIGTINVGHCHPKVTAALREQAGKLLHTSFHVCAYPGYMDVCRKLIETVPGKSKKKAILFNSGSEAVENAVKFARAHTKRRAIVSFDFAFHGRTKLCLTLDGKFKPLRQGIGPFAPDIHRSTIPYEYRGLTLERTLEDLDRLFLTTVAPEDIAAIIIEPVLGEGGFIVPANGFLKALRERCDQHGMLLIVDEVQTGFGRTGRFWAMEHEGIVPDLVTIGKSLGAGMPISAVVGRADVMDSVNTGAVGGTYGGNPMSCAAALAVFEIFHEEQLVARANGIGKKVKTRFDSWAEKLPIVGESRGLGAMRAIELVRDKKTKEHLAAADVKKILHKCQEDGLIVIKAGVFDNVIRTLMPLTIPDEDLLKGLDVLENALKEHKE